MKIDGGCHCGFIAYEGEADPEKAAICHCTDCQKLSGSAFRTVVPVADKDFRMTGGAPTIYVKTGDSGNKRQQAFCPKCGSPIFSAPPERRPEELFHPRRHHPPARPVRAEIAGLGALQAALARRHRRRFAAATTSNEAPSPA